MILGKSEYNCICQTKLNQKGSIRFLSILVIYLHDKMQNSLSIPSGNIANRNIAELDLPGYRHQISLTFYANSNELIA